MIGPAPDRFGGRLQVLTVGHSGMAFGSADVADQAGEALGDR